MKKVFTSAVCGILLLLSCRMRSPAEIKEVCGIRFSTIVQPRNGEGELIQMHSAKPFAPFVKVMAEVIPFEHKIFRIVMYADDADIVKCAADIAEKYDITFTAAGDSRSCILEKTAVTLRPALFLGPRGVEAEFVDLQLASKAKLIKSGTNFAEVRLKQTAQNHAAILTQAVIEYQLDTGSLPATLDALYKNTANSPAWNGPYTDLEAAAPGVIYIYSKLPEKKFRITYRLTAAGKK